MHEGNLVLNIQIGGNGASTARLYIYLLNVPSFSSRYFNKIKLTSRLGRLLALSLEILQRLWPFKLSTFYARFNWKRLRAHTYDRLYINYAFITCLLYCASDVNVFLRHSRSQDSRFPAMIYTKTSFLLN